MKLNPPTAAAISPEHSEDFTYVGKAQHHHSPCPSWAKKIAAEVHHLELSAAGCSYNVVWCRVIHTYLRVCIGLSAAAIATP
jgi:hypothetical protein